MTKFNDLQMQEIQKIIQNSSLWKKLNQKAKALYLKQNKIPNDQEYQALRNILICKVLLEDKQVKNKVYQLMCDTLE